MIPWRQLTAKEFLERFGIQYDEHVRDWMCAKGLVRFTPSSWLIVDEESE